MPPLSPRFPENRKPFTGFLLIIGLIVLAAGSKTILYDTLDPDCFWHLRVGEQLARDGVRPLRDSLSFASIREPWTPYSWLAELAMSKLWAIGGFRAAILSAAMLIAGTMIFVALSCREAIRASLDDGPADAVLDSQRFLATALATAFAAFLSLPYLSFRPVAAAIFLLSICAWLIFRDRRLNERSRSIWLVIPSTVLLVNLHLFAVLVPMWFAALFAGAIWERIRLFDPADGPECLRCIHRYAILCVISTLACTMTPMLPGVIATLSHYSFHDPMVASNVIGEMQPFWHGGLGKISLLLVLLLATCLYFRHRRLRAGEILLLSISTALLLWMGRFAPIFALIAAPAFAVTMPKLSDAVLGRPLLRAAITTILLLGLGRTFIAFPSNTTDLGAWLNRNGAGTPGYPVEAARFVAAAIPRESGRLINEFNWGGYLEWRLGDHFQVLLDGRTQVYSPEFWNAVYLGDADSRQRFLSHVRADAAVLPAGKSRFKSTLLGLGWKTVHQDDRAEVLVPPEEWANVDEE
jgi:hypothetical protein